MSLLETFLILFESDSKDVKEGADQADKSVKKLEDTIGKTDSATAKLGGSLVGAAKSAAGLLAAFISAGAVAAKFSDTIHFADQLDEASEALGISVENLSAWGDAAKLAGGSSEGFRADVATLSANMAQLDTLGKSRVQPFFKELGISMTEAGGKAKDPLELFKEISGAFEGMSKAESIGFGRKLGLSQGTIMLLQQGRRGLDELIQRQRELGVVTAEQAKEAAQWKDTMDDLSHVFRTIAGSILRVLLPPLTMLGKGFVAVGKFANENGQIISSVLIAVSGALLYRLAPAIAAVALEFIAVPLLAFLATASIAGFGAAVGIAAASVWAFLSPILLVIAVVAIAALVIDDLWSAFNGGPSVIGKTIEWLKSFGDDLIWLMDKIKEFFNFGGIKDFVMNGVAAIQGAASNGLAAQSAGSVATSGIGLKTNSRTVNTGDINIQTQATDAEGISKSIGTSLQQHMNQTIDANDDGVLM